MISNLSNVDRSVADSEEGLLKDPQGVSLPSAAAGVAHQVIYEQKPHSPVALAKGTTNSTSVDDIMAVSPGVYTTVSGAKRLCVTNLAYDATIMTVVIEFHKFGTVAEVCVPMNRDGDMNQGIAYVEYALAEDAYLAQKSMTGACILGRIIRVNAVPVAITRAPLLITNTKEDIDLIMAFENSLKRECARGLERYAKANAISSEPANAEQEPVEADDEQLGSDYAQQLNIPIEKSPEFAAETTSNSLLVNEAGTLHSECVEEYTEDVKQSLLSAEFTGNEDMPIMTAGNSHPKYVEPQMTTEDAVEPSMDVSAEVTGQLDTTNEPHLECGKDEVKTSESSPGYMDKEVCDSENHQGEVATKQIIKEEDHTNLPMTATAGLPVVPDHPMINIKESCESLNAKDNKTTVNKVCKPHEEDLTTTTGPTATVVIDLPKIGEGACKGFWSKESTSQEYKSQEYKNGEELAESVKKSAGGIWTRKARRRAQRKQRGF